MLSKGVWRRLWFAKVKTKRRGDAVQEERSSRGKLGRSSPSIQKGKQVMVRAIMWIVADGLTNFYNLNS